MSQEFTLVDEILCHVSFHKHTDELRLRPVIPNNQLALRLINSVHMSKLYNHIAINSTYKILNAKYYIKNLLELIRRYIKSCIICEMAKDIEPQGSGFESSLTLTKGRYPFHYIYLDIKHMYESKNKFNYLLICVDSYSKYLIGEPLKNRTASEIIGALLKISGYFGLCNHVITDLESSITSAIFQAFLQFLNIKITFCYSLGHAQNAHSERGISRLICRLRFLLSQKEQYWDQLTPIACLSANSLIQNNGYTAFQLMYGRSPKNTFDIANADLDFKVPNSEKEYFENLKDNFKLADKVCRESDVMLKTMQVARHRNKIKDLKGFAPFDLVYLYSPRSACYMKTSSIKITFRKVGPVLVQNVYKDRIFTLRTLDNRKIEMKVHGNRLERANLLIADQMVNNLISLKAAIRQHGQKNREEILKKLDEAEQSILLANKDLKINQDNENDDISPVIEDKENVCVIGEIEDKSTTGNITKLKWKNGDLMVLLQIGNQKLPSWHWINEFNEDIRDMILSSKIKVIGSLQKFRKQLGLSKY